MKSEHINTLLSEISESGLNPNEYFCLFLIVQGKPQLDTINCDLCKKKLMTKGWIDRVGGPTDKFFEQKLFDDIKRTDLHNGDFAKKVEDFRSMWPAILLPSGQYARSPSIELSPKFRWFFQTFPFDWDVVHKATREYVTYYQERNYIFMKTSSYFICKQDTMRLKKSTLAEWCERVSVSGYDDTPKTFDIDL